MQLKENVLSKSGVSNENRKFQLIVFKLGEEEYGLHIDQIKEVVLTPNITRLPQTLSYVKGVANIRGNVIAILDLGEKFALNDKEANAQQIAGKYTLVLESEDIKAGVLVKEVPNTLNVAISELEDVTNIINDGNAEQSYIKGIVKRDDRLIIMIDIFKVVNDYELAGIFKRNIQNAHV